MAGQVIRGKDLDKAITLDCDLCVIGTGAGGAVVAARAAEAGRKVVILEAGGLFRRDRFKMQESEAFPDLYQDRGTRQTADKAITVLQGRSVGGGTTINWTTCFRTPESILDHWRKQHGIKSWTSAALVPHFEAVETRLNIEAWPEALANQNNKKLLEGARSLGWQAGPTRRNVRGCVNSGYCGMGCPVDAKQAMQITYISDAVADGATLVTDCHVHRLERDGEQIRAVIGEAMEEASEEGRAHRVTVLPQKVVVAGGALNSPALLLASDLDANDRVGKRTFLHPVIGVAGRYREPVQAFYGAPQSITSHQFAEPKAGEVGFFLETAPVHPALVASVFSGFGKELEDQMASLDHMGIMIALHIDGLLPGDEGGRVHLSQGRPSLHYPISPALARAFKASHQRLAELTLAAGAEEAQSLHLEPVKMRQKDDVRRLTHKPYGALQHPIFSAHQMGGCAMGPDPKTSVVDERLKIHGLANAYVVDGSVLPTSLGVNPSETIYGMAHRATEWITRR